MYYEIDLFLESNNLFSEFITVLVTTNSLELKSFSLRRIFYHEVSEKDTIYFILQAWYSERKDHVLFWNWVEEKRILTFLI